MMRLSRIHQRVASLARQRGFLRLSMLIPRWGSKGFSVQDGFRQSEPGIHLETYDPNTILKRRNLLTWTEQFDNAAWTKRGTCAVTPNAAAAPDGTLTADLVSGIGALGTSDLFYATYASLGSFAAGVSFAPSLRIKRVSTVGVLRISNPTNAAHGEWRVDMALLSDAWETITATHPAVTVTTSFFAGLANQGGLQISAVSGAPLSLHLWGAQFELGSTASAYQKVTDWNTEFLAAGGDRVTMFQEPACITPVTAVEQVIGGFISSERGTVRGPELFTDAAANLAGGATRVSPGVYRINTSGAYCAVELVAALVTDTTYEVLFNVDVVTTAGSGLSVDTGGPLNLTGTGPKRMVFKATGSTFAIKRAAAVATDYQISGISVKAIPGKVATQSTAGFKPKLEARVNLLTKTEQFTDAAWVKALADSTSTQGTGVLPTVTDNYAAAPDGTQTAARVQMSLGAGGGNAASGTNRSGIRQLLTGVPLAPVKDAIYIKVLAGPTLAAMQAGTLLFGTVAGGALTTTFTDIGNGWYKVQVSSTPTTSSGTWRIQLWSGPGSTVDSADILVWHPDFRTAADAALDIPAYQRVNTASDYDTEGFPHRCRGDGSDDYLSVPLNMSTVNAVDVWVSGSLKQNDAASQVLLEFTATSSTTAGSFGLVAPNFGNADLQFRAGGTTPAIATNVGVGAAPAPLNAIVFGSSDIAAPMEVLELNGVEKQRTATSQGAGNFANDTLYIGRRGGSTLPSGAGFCAMTIRGGARSDAGFKARMLRLHARLSKIKV